jgi:N-acetylglucosamine malate deacetylase 1
MRILAIGAHPDDLEIYAWGSLCAWNAMGADAGACRGDGRRGGRGRRGALAPLRAGRRGRRRWRWGWSRCSSAFLTAG